MPSSQSVTTGNPRQEGARERSAPERADDLSVLLTTDHSVAELLGTIVEVAAGALDPFSGVSVTLLTDGDRHYETTNASSDQIRTVDESQYASDSGPCIEAIRTGGEVKSVIPSPSWPDFSQVAEQARIRSVWSLPLTVQERVTAALNLYSDTDAPWESSSAGPARLLARQAAAVLDKGVVLARSEHANVTLRRALETRTVIGQAQGVLMARQSIGPDEAFDILRRASQRTNRKLRDVATEIVAGVSQGRHHP